MLYVAWVVAKLRVAPRFRNRRVDSCIVGIPCMVFVVSVCCGMPSWLLLPLCLQLSAHCQSTATSTFTRSVTGYNSKCIYNQFTLVVFFWGGEWVGRVRDGSVWLESCVVVGVVSSVWDGK